MRQGICSVLVAVICFGAFDEPAYGSPVYSARADSVLYAAAGQTVEGCLYIYIGFATKVVPCKGGSRENAVYLGGMGCSEGENPTPLSTPIVIVVVREECDFVLEVVADGTKIVDRFEFKSVMSNGYRFETAGPIPGASRCTVRLFLDGVFAGEVETNVGTLAGVK